MTALATRSRSTRSTGLPYDQLGRPDSPDAIGAATDKLMSETPSNSPASALSLDERKFATDRELRLQEIALKVREVAVKETELHRSRWLNPTVIGLAVAGSGLFGNLIVAYIANTNTQAIEHFKAQSNLIVQAVGTGDQKSACRNLLSFIHLGLLDDPQLDFPHFGAGLWLCRRPENVLGGDEFQGAVD